MPVIEHLHTDDYIQLEETTELTTIIRSMW